MPGARILNETGDGFFLRFQSASDDIETALSLYDLMHDEVCKAEPLKVSAGVHMGETAEMDVLR